MIACLIIIVVIIINILLTLVRNQQMLEIDPKDQLNNLQSLLNHQNHMLALRKY